MEDSKFETIKKSLFDLQKIGIDLDSIEDAIAIIRSENISMHLENIDSDTSIQDIIDNSSDIVNQISEIIRFCMVQCSDVGIPVTDMFKFISSLVVNSLSFIDYDEEESDDTCYDDNDEYVEEKDELEEIVDSLF